MPEPLARIHAALMHLARRERRLLLLRAFVGGVGAVALAWAVLATLVNTGWASRASGPWWVLLAGVTAACVAAWPLRAWHSVRDVRRQAARVEDLRPELRGALLTVLDHQARPAPDGVAASPLLGRMAQRVVPTVAEVPAAQAWPATPLRRSGALAALALAALGAVGLVWERGPVEALAALLDPLEVAPVAEEAPVDGPRALVGDITLRYLYPTYTRMEPLEVPNSNGDVRAPPGTKVEIRARSAEAHERAALRVYDAEPVAIEVFDGRELRGELTVAGGGVWRFEFEDLPSPDYRIVPDPDLPPDVSVEAARRTLAVNADKPLYLRWTTRDDYGVRELEVEVAQGGEKRRVSIRKLLDAPREAMGEVRLTPAELGLGPGDEATLRIASWDNDEVSGSKVGYSSAIQVKVLGPKGRAARQDRYRRLIRDALVLVLADFVVEPSPVADEGDRAAAWSTTANGRYEEFDRLVQEAWGGAESDTFDATLVRTVGERRRELFSFARSLKGAGSLSDRDGATFAGLQDGHTESLEGAILMLDQVIRAAAVADLAALVEEVAREAGDLNEDFAKLTAPEALARLDKFERLFGQLAREAAKLDEGDLREFINDRSASARGLMAEIRKALAEGRMDEARELLERLATQMRQMAEDMADMQARRDAQSKETEDMLAKLKEELSGLREDQQALRERTEAAREKHGQDMDQAVESWQQVEKLAAGIVERQRALEGDLGPFQEADYGNRAALEDARSEADGLHDSARGRDLETALERADRLADAMAWLQQRAASAQRRGTSPGADLGAADRVLRQQRADVEKVRRLLEEMARQQAKTSPALQQELQQMAEQQQQLAERAEQAAKHAEQLAGQLPMQAPGLERGTRQAADQGRRAAEAMQQGEAMEAEGGQRAAEAGLQEAEQALEEAQRNMEQMQRASRSSRGQQDQGEGEEGKEDGDGGSVSDEDIPLPAPEEFLTPEEYRRALLEGMEGDVPEEYKALNRRYYEELVRQ